MNKILLLAVLFLAFSGKPLFSQESIHDYKGNYIFDAYEALYRCDNLGTVLDDAPVTVEIGSVFNVVHVLESGELVINFWEWTGDTLKKELFNGKMEHDEYREYFFLLPKVTFTLSCSEYTPQINWDIAFGALTTPFKIRPKPFYFTSDLSLGANISAQHTFTNNFSWGGVLGLSLSSISLDSFSTAGFIMTNTERPAITPTFSLMGGYKNINLIVGVGFDFINKTSETEKSWIYWGKPWIGVGIGVSLFNSQAPTATSKAADQGGKD